MAYTEQFRLFIAVTIPEEIKAKIQEAQGELRRALPERAVRWTRREQFHLTMRFLGDVEAARVEALEDMMRQAGFAQISIRLNSGSAQMMDQMFPGLGLGGVVASAAIEAIKA